MERSPISAGGGIAVLPVGASPLMPDDPAEVGGRALVGRLGTGGMGVVYLARDDDGSLMAVKVARSDIETPAEEVRTRFRAEVACLRQVPARCTARLLVDGTEETPPYIITEYVDGRSLKDIVERDGPLPPEQLRALATGVMRALASIHQAGLIHRDLKPANVLVTPTGPRVIDFGIAQGASVHDSPTQTGTVVGSVGWIAPERLSRGPVTPASDIFCWGCLIAYAGTARNPYGTGGAVEMAGRVLFDTPHLDGLDPSVRPLVEAALTKDPSHRPPAERLLARLSPADPLAASPTEHGESEEQTATTTTIALFGGARPNPKRRALAVATAAVAVAAATTAVFTIGPNDPTSGTTTGPAVQQTQGHRSTTAGAADAAVIARHRVTSSRRPTANKGPGKAPTAKPTNGHKPPSGQHKPGHGKKGPG